MVDREELRLFHTIVKEELDRYMALSSELLANIMDGKTRPLYQEVDSTRCLLMSLHLQLMRLEKFLE